MIRCPVCQHENFDGALYCSECGAPLYVPATTQNLTVGEDTWLPTSENFRSEGAGKGARIVLFLVESGQRIFLESGQEWTLGRLASGQAVVPDVDLTAYNAYEQGVSRLHAALRVDAHGRLTITDMGSSNGTRVNGIKILPNTPHPLQHGDIVALGKLVFQVLIQPVSTEEGK
ncbi:MAG TPA: FHA domain-containing protein [Chloroflexi bacterium]|nr:FHA domain-containing protein [Chloroflexota bacterium]